VLAAFSGCNYKFCLGITSSFNGDILETYSFLNAAAIKAAPSVFANALLYGKTFESS